MSWVERTSFNPDVKNWSYDKIIKAFGEDKGEQVCKHFGVKKEKKSSKKENKD